MADRLRQRRGGRQLVGRHAHVPAVGPRHVERKAVGLEVRPQRRHEVARLVGGDRKRGGVMQHQGVSLDAGEDRIGAHPVPGLRRLVHRERDRRDRQRVEPESAREPGFGVEGGIAHDVGPREPALEMRQRRAIAGRRQQSGNEEV